MSTSGCILKKKDKYIVENMVIDIKNAISKANLHMRGESVFKDLNGSFNYLNLGIFDDVAFNLEPDDFGNEEVEQGQCINFYVDAIDEEYVDEEAFNWVANGNKLCKVAFIEEVRDCEEIIYKFIYEYLKLNPQDYFWVEDEWVYTLEDMERLHKLPFDENWCYKNPNID